MQGIEGKHVRDGFNSDGTEVPEFKQAEFRKMIFVSEAQHAKTFEEIMTDINSGKREGTLGEVIDRRVQVYGEPVNGFTEIAQVWSTYLGHTIQAHEVPMMFILMKIIRSKTSPDYSDHSDDIEGYLDIFRKVIGDDMIKARTVTEYIEKKWPNG